MTTNLLFKYLTLKNLKTSTLPILTRIVSLIIILGFSSFTTTVHAKVTWSNKITPPVMPSDFKPIESYYCNTDRSYCFSYTEGQLPTDPKTNPNRLLELLKHNYLDLYQVQCNYTHQTGTNLSPALSPNTQSPNVLICYKTINHMYSIIRAFYDVSHYKFEIAEVYYFPDRHGDYMQALKYAQQILSK